MGRLSTEYFIARRLVSGEGSRKNGVMTRIACVSVAIGLAVMIFSLGVIFGFKSEITDKLTGFMSHVQIRHFDNNLSFETVPISSEQPFTDSLRRIPGFAGMNRYAIKAGIIKSEEAIQGIMLKGVGGEFDWSFFKKNLTAGSIPSVEDSIRKREVLISQTVARKMGLSVGDKFSVVFVNPARSDLFRVGGIYDTGLKNIDEVVVMCDIRDVQRLNRWKPTEITGFEVATSDFSTLESFSGDVFSVVSSMSDRIHDQLMVTNLKESNPVIFDWLDTHDLNAAIIITVMLLVVIFTMTSALLIILLEKTPVIGILKAIGIRNSSVRRIFVARSSFIVLKGMVWGNAVGIGLCYLQKCTGLLKLDAEGYFLSSVPVEIDWWYVVSLNIGVFIVTLTLLLLPAMVVSKIVPQKSIRFE